MLCRALGLRCRALGRPPGRSEDPLRDGVAAGTTLFLIPILVFTVLLRKHLLRGITFGAVRK
jgi:ABC-type glycerol-3-phosphate transport system permease component